MEVYLAIFSKSQNDNPSIRITIAIKFSIQKKPQKMNERKILSYAILNFVFTGWNLILIV